MHGLVDILSQICYQYTMSRGIAVGRSTCDWKVTGSNPGSDAAA